MIPAAAPPLPPPRSPEILPVRIGPFDRVIIGGIPFGNAKPSGDDSGSYLLSRLDVSPPLSETFTQARLQQERDKPGYRFDRGWFAPEKAGTRERTSIERLADLADDELPAVMWKLEWVSRFLVREANGQAVRASGRKVSRSDDVMEELIPEIEAESAELDIAKSRKPGRGKRKARAGTKGPPPTNAPCVRIWRDWIVTYENAGLNPCVLRNNKGGNRDRRISIKIALLMWKHAVRYAALNRPKKKHLYKDLCDEIDTLPENAQAVAANAAAIARGKEGPTKLPLPHPSDKAFFNVINKLDRYDVYAGRYGVLAAKRKFAMVAGGLDVTRPGQRVEIDEWQVSLMVLLIDAGLWEYLSPEQQAQIERGRMWICAAIDCATRCIVGMRLAPTPSAANAIATLRMIVSDKSAYASAAGAVTLWDMRCSPEQIASDSGSSFIADATQSVIIDLSGSPKIPPIDLTHHRGRIERVFGTVHTALISRLHGRTFENTVELGDYNPQAMANLDVDELAVVLVRFVVDAYHNMPHEGLGGETPRNAWRRLTKAFHVNEPPDRDKMRAIFGIKKTYKIRAGGIHMLGLNYNSEHLEVHRRHVGSGVEVDVRVDAEDIGAISVRVGKDWLTVPCVHGGFDRVRLSDWIATLADIGRRFAREAKVAEPAVREALRAIQQVSANGIARSGIGARIDTVAEIERAERDLAISFTWAKPDPQISSTGAGLFDNLVPVGGDEPSAKAAPQIAPDDEASPSPTKPADRSAPARKYRMED